MINHTPLVPQPAADHPALNDEALAEELGDLVVLEYAKEASKPQGKVRSFQAPPAPHPEVTRSWSLGGQYD